MILPPRTSRFFAALALAWLGLFCFMANAEPRAVATISQTAISPGDGITMTIDISGAQPASPVPTIEVTGLDINFQGARQSAQFSNGRVDRSVTLIYLVTGRNPGSFTIPAIDVKTDAGVLQTAPVALKVEPPKPGGQQPAGGDEPRVFARIDVPKKTVWLGEAVPVEVRLFVDQRIRLRIDEMPVLEGEGFTKVRFPRPREETMRKDGRDYEVIAFRTTISPGKAGKVTLGPMDVPFIASIPRAKRARGNSPFDPFDNGLMADAFGAFGQMERRKVTAEPVELNVKPLPAVGRPADFSGAVGKYQMAVESNPKKVKVGDPVTLKMRISGTGNFDRVNAPVLVEPAGWHPYEASSDFKPNDELSSSGAKTFEMAVVPEERKTQMPQVQFSYFDPDAEKYVTLKSDPAPLVVEGGAPPPVAAKATPASQPAATPEPAKAVVTDIVGLKYERGARRESFEPMYRSRIFWIAQGVPLLALIGLLGVRFLRKDEASSRLAALRRERNELWRKVRSESAHAEFFQKAARLVQVETALATGRSDASVDAAAARASSDLDEETASGIDEIFSKRAELLYAGSAPSDGRVSQSDRDRALTALERFQESHARS